MSELSWRRYVDLRRALDASWTPAWLLIGSIALIAAPIVYYPARLVLNLLPYIVLFGVAWWILDRVARTRTRNLALLALAVLCIVPSYSDNRTIVGPAYARRDSPVLWSMTLQHPDQAILRHIRLPDSARLRGWQYRLLVRLERNYRGPARLLATVNGVPIGTVQPFFTKSAVEPFAGEWGVAVPPEVLALRPVTEIVIRQDTPDPELRTVIYSQWAGATLGVDAAWFFDGTEWHRGVVHPISGQMVPGLPHIWLAREA